MLVQVFFWLALALAHTVAAPSGGPQRETTRSPHGALNVPCENCHTAAGWRPIRRVLEFDHNKTKYPLRGMHEKVQCTQCHSKPEFAEVGKNCQDCHADIHQRKMGTDCASCHTVLGWQIATQQIKDHQNRFPLLGAHAAVPCEECHKNAAVGQFQGLSTDCASCHLRDFQNTANPNHPSANFSTKCETCHSADSWLGAKFDHAGAPANFPLTNGHANVPCASCHINNNYNLQIAPSDCGHSGCHLTTWQQTNNPVHSAAGPVFALANCANCHTTKGWDAANFDHSSTGFLLVDGHANVPCTTCHINNNYGLQIAPTDCGNSGCHLTKWQQTNSPPHPTSGPAFGAANCAHCHTPKGWDAASFDHSVTGFLLTNGHANVPCASCHVNNNYALQMAPTDCGNSGCHLTKWQQTNNPTHPTAGPAFAAANCAHCHTTKGWDAASFDHSVTGLALTGTHASPTPTPCLACHVSNNYSLNSADCIGCHLTAWSSTPAFGGSVPDHIKSGFPTTASACATCHSITKWADGKFDHSAFGFPLTNAHALVSSGGKVPGCTSCHISNNYSLNIAPTDCGNSGCHLSDWQKTNNPTHAAAGAAFASSNCATCHNTISWNTTTFDHSVTGWALTGTHSDPVKAPCSACHISNNYNLTSTDCYGCHQAAWNSTPSFGGNVPDHLKAGFPTSLCSTCHDTVTWTNSTFNHASTGFPLTNKHTTVACAACHINNNYNLQIGPRDCGNSGCHLSTWQQTNNPVHSTAGPAFAAANCANCHTTAGWDAASFNHSVTGFALMGTHSSPTPTPCAACHVNNNYSLNTSDCLGCHLAAWNSTPTFGGNVPDHIKSGFPSTASACASCHPITRWADGKFDHSTTGWPLTGAHANPAKAPCSACHINNNYTLTAANTDCYGCHAAAWQSTATLGGTVPNHIATGYPTTCAACHNTTSWLGATFNHTFFPIPHHGSVCNDCHLVPTNYATFSCINCHTSPFHSKAQTDPQHQGVGGYVYGPTTCYSCHKGGGG